MIASLRALVLRDTPRSLAKLGLILLLVVATTTSNAAAALRDSQGMLLVDGRPRLLLGLYENPASDADLQDAVRHGFNLFQCRPETSDLDRLDRLGAKAWVNLGDALDLSTETTHRQDRLSNVVHRIRHHPALLIWEGPDEILWNQWWGPMETVRAELRTMRTLSETQRELAPLVATAQILFDRGLYAEFEEARTQFWTKAGQPCPNPKVRIDDSPNRVRAVGDGITAGLRFVRRLDPNHVLWMNHAPRNSLQDLRLFNREADMAGCDIYPAPANLDVGHSDLADMTLASVGAYTRRMRDAAPGRSCAMVLQSFGWRDLRERITDHHLALGIGRPPTFRESRFMAYDAILHGANAILYWGTAYAKPTEQEKSAGQTRPQLWRDLLRLGRELRALEPALLAKPGRTPRLRLAATFGSHDRFPLIATVRQVGDDTVLILANESGHGFRFAVEGLSDRVRSRTLYRLHSTEQHQLAGGHLDDGIAPYDVHVYATSRRFETVVP
ncbi:MAG: hypothetical protein JNK85_28155 [Verrucomicrobiales bacterium]|nr:hypothetical protein [Verrucomicrobiales bacterium]